MESILGLDIGGTKLSTVVGTAGGEIIAKVQRSTGEDKRVSVILDLIFDMLTQVINDAQINPRDTIALGISFCGPVNPITGQVITAHVLTKDWDGFNLQEAFQKKLGIPTYVENDANAAVLAEGLFGSAQGKRCYFYMTISTGIGGGLVIDGEIFRGANHLAGEIGHTRVTPDGPRCTCGRYGCLEAHASGTALALKARQDERLEDSLILQLVSRNKESITSKIIARAAHAGDSLALRIFEEAGYYVGIALANLIKIIDPEMIIIGGGVTKAGDILFNPIRKKLKEEAFKQAANIDILPSPLGDCIGDLGALSVALKGIADTPTEITK